MTTVCPGRCNTYPRSKPDGVPPSAWVWGEPVWCTPCSSLIRAALRAMPDAWRALGVVPYLTPRPPSDELATHVSGSRERPSPGPGVDKRDEMARLLSLWEDDLRAYLHSGAAMLLPGSREALVRATQYLNTNFDRMMARTECARDFGEEILESFWSVLRMVKNGPTRRKLHIPCPRCDVRALVVQEGVAGRPWYTECSRHLGGCGALFTEQEMTWMVEVRLATRR